MKFSVKNCKEFITLGKVVSLKVIEAVKKDGYQHEDLLAYLGSEEFSKAAQDAFEDAGLVFEEVKDVSFIEGIELARHAYLAADEIVDALRAL